MIISNDNVNITGDYLVAQITSKAHADGLSVDIENSDCSVPLPFKSYIRSHKLFTIYRERILSKFSSVSLLLLQKLQTKILQNITAAAIP